MMGGSLYLGLIGYYALSCADASLIVLIIHSQKASSDGMVIVCLSSSLGPSLGDELCFYSSKIGVLSNSQPCPPNRPILLFLLRIVFGVRKELTIVNIIDNGFSAVLPYVLFLTCRVVF